jgi:hypothetical protein
VSTARAGKEAGPEFRVKSRWRLVACATLTVVGILGLLYFKHHAVPGRSVLPDHPDPWLQLDVYVEDPNATVTARFDVTDDVQGAPEATLYMTCTQRGGAILLADRVDEDDVLHRLATEPSILSLPWLPQTYVGYVPCPIASPDDPRGGYITTFKLSQGTFKLDRGVFSGRLPGLATHESGDDTEPFLGTTASVPEQPEIGRYLYENVHLRNPNGPFIPHHPPSDYETLSGQPIKHLYWQPKHLATSEYLLDAATHIAGADVKVNQPVGVAADNLAFAWRGSYGLSPFLETEDRKAEDQRNSSEFFAGIFLALTAAALIAFLQEWPNRFRFGRKRRAAATAFDPSGSAGAPFPGSSGSRTWVPLLDERAQRRYYDGLIRSVTRVQPLLSGIATKQLLSQQDHTGRHQGLGTEDRI